MHTHEDQESLLGFLKNLKPFFLNFLHESIGFKSNRGFWLSNDYPAQGLFSPKEKSPKLHYENWYAAYILSNSTALMRQITTTCKWSVFVLCNMWEKEYQWVCIVCFTETPSLYVYVHVKYVKLKWVSCTLRLHVQKFSISPPNGFFLIFLIQVIISPMYCNVFFFSLKCMFLWNDCIFLALCPMYDFTL